MNHFFAILAVLALCLPAYPGEPDGSGGKEKGKSPAGQSREKPVDLLLDRAKRYYNDSNYGDAIRDLKVVITLEPRHYEAWHYLGGSHHHREEYPEAIEAYSRALEINPRAEYSFLNRGMAKHRQGDIPEAIRDYSQSLEIRREFFKSLYYRGLAHIETGNYESAINDLNLAIMLNPSHYASWYLKGLARYKKGDLKGGQIDFSQAVQLSHDKVLPEYKWDLNPFRLKKDDRIDRKIPDRGKTKGTMMRDKNI